MGEISKAVGQWIVGNVGWTAIIALFILSGLFKIAKVEINPLGWIIEKIGNIFSKSVRDDIAKLQSETNQNLADLRRDLDAFETKTNQSIADMKQGNTYNCELVKARMDQMEKSNDMQTVRQIKAHVLDFANSCLNGRKHTKQDFDNLIKENEEYEVLVKKYGLINDVYTEDFHYIMKVYRKCMEERSFLRDDG